MGSKKPSLLFHKGSACNNQSQTISIYIKKNVAMLSQHIQHTLLKIHQYRVQILYKPGLEIFIAD